MIAGHHYPFSGTGLPPATASGVGRSLTGRFTEQTNRSDRRRTPGNRERRARIAWRMVQSGTLAPQAAAGPRRDFAPEFARFAQTT